MNNRNLIISFVTVSIAALIVSSLAVFTVARRYASEFSSRENDETDETVSPPETTVASEESLSLPTVNDHPESEGETSEEARTEYEDETSEDARSEYEDETSSVPEETTVSITETEELSTAASDFSLTISGGRLVILSPKGETVYERIVDVSELNPKDKESLIAGILFPDIESAMNAVYDLIS